MTRATCGRFPTGTAHIRTPAGIVTFVDGEAEVTDPSLVEGLGLVAAVFAVAVDEPARRPAKTSPAPRRKRTSQRKG